MFLFAPFHISFKRLMVCDAIGDGVIIKSGFQYGITQLDNWLIVNAFEL